MGIQINGQTDTISAVDGALTVSGAELPTVTNLNATGISTFSNGIVIGTGTSISSPATNTLTLGTNNAERLRVSAGGVSIGSIATYGDSNASFTSLSLGGNGTRYGLLEIKQSNGVAGAWIDSYGTGGNGDLRITTAGTSGAITFWTGGAFTEKVRIDSSGNLGIGITNPSSKFEVQGGQFRIRASGTYSEPTDNAGVIGYDSFSGDLTISARSSGGSTAISFRTSNSGTGSERVRIDSSGKVTMPNQPAFYIVHSGGGGINQQNTTVILNSPIVNRDSAYSTSTGRYTCPITGLYQFFFGTIKSDNGITPDPRVSRFNIRKNGTNISTELRLSENGGYGESASMVCIAQCNANDFIDVYITDTGGWYGTSYAHFGGFLIG